MEYRQTYSLSNASPSEWAAMLDPTTIISDRDSDNFDDNSIRDRYAKTNSETRSTLDRMIAEKATKHFEEIGKHPDFQPYSSNGEPDNWMFRQVCFC